MWLTPISRQTGSCAHSPRIKSWIENFLILGILISLLGQTGPYTPAAAQGTAMGSLSDSWLYLRNGQPLTGGELPVEVVAVGDIMLGRTVRANAQTLAGVSSWLSSADLTIGNFEGVLAPTGKDPVVLSQTIPGKPYHLVMGRQIPKLLHEAGFDLLSLANNHGLDLKTAGLEDTLGVLGSTGLEVIGVSPAPGADQPAIIRDVNGLKIAFLAFSMIPTPSRPAAGLVPTRYDAEKSAAAVQAVRPQADVVIVNMHWGVEYQTYPDPAQIRAAKNLYAAGADLIIGHHPHVVQGTAVLSGSDLAMTEPFREPGFVAYSLGNFVFDQFEGETLYGLALRLFLDKEGVRGVEALPLQAATRPRLLTQEESVPLLARLQPASQSTTGFVCDSATCQQCTLSESAQGGVFVTGQSDLTGDGKPETVSLTDGTIHITQAGKIVWTSPSEWQVLDLALGDPNDDGRAELLVSLRKADPDGLQRSHPFIVGYRGGMYKLLWGGSALSTPITEVELGDVDGDGSDELVVLEEQAGASRSVSVLDWHGWGFLLHFRSKPGYFQNLALQEDTGAPKKNIVVEHFPADHAWDTNKLNFR